VAEQTRVPELGQGADMLGDRAGLLLQAGAPAEIDDVELVETELADVLLDLSAELVRPRVRFPGAVA
jgi:hypothetical protein